MATDGAVKVTTPTDREIVITREFNAPRDRVWSAMTQPQLLKRWLLGPSGWTMTVCENEVRPGGIFRHCWRNGDGMEMSMRGVYREVVQPERIVRTETFDFGCDSQSGEQLATLVLTEHGGMTRSTLSLLYPTKEARDGAIASGMKEGLAAGYDRLDAIMAGE